MSDQVTEPEPDLDGAARDIVQFARIAETEHRLIIQGISLTNSDLQMLLSHMPQRHGHPVVKSIHLRDVTFQDSVDLSGINVLGNVAIYHCIGWVRFGIAEAAFWGSVTIEGCEFSELVADGSQFHGAVNFHTCTFSRKASFAGTTFTDGLSFTYVGQPGKTRTRRVGADGRKYTSLQADEGVVGCEFNADLDMTGLRIRGPLILRACRLQNSKLTRLQAGGIADFRASRFSGRVSFNHATFSNSALFHGAKFEDSSFIPPASERQSPIDFNSARFHGEATFDDARFKRLVDFRDARFQGRATFSRASFVGGATFYNAAFSGTAGFHLARFERGCVFTTALFEKMAYFTRVTFGNSTRFSSARFIGGLNMRWSKFEGAVSFDQSSISGQVDLSDMNWPDKVTFEAADVDCELLNLNDGRFAEYVDIEMSAREIQIIGSKFSSGGKIRLKAETKLFLEGCDINGPLIVAGPSDNEASPQILSLRDSNVEKLSIEALSLEGCQFFGAHNLDRMRVGGGVVFGRTPRLTRRPVTRLPRLWTAREVIAEEWMLREAESKWGWSVSPARPLHSGNAAPNAIQTSGIYRALRKGREDSKDAPGAADMYYGEMEMRRLGAPRASAERLVLWLYWLTSGYGLRASRALGLLIALLALAAGGYALIGLKPQTETVYAQVGTYPSYVYQAQTRPLASQPSAGDRLGTGAMLSLESGVSLLRAPTPNLTGAGRVIESINRLFAPVLLGLGLLSLRGRVKR